MTRVTGNNFFNLFGGLQCFWLLPFYILLTGASPSIVRAGLMAMVALYAARKGVTKDVLHSMAIVAWVMLVWNPYFLLDVSFQLSFLVTLGLILGVQRVNDLLKGWITSSVLRNTASITLVSQFVSFPVSIYYFNQFSLLSWLANAVLVPVISLAVFPAGIVAVVAGLLYLPAGQGIGWFISWLNDAIFWVTDKLQQLSLFKQIWPTPSLPWIAFYYLLLIGIYGLWRRCMLGNMDEPPIRLESLQDRGGAKYAVGLWLAVGGFLVLLWIGYSPDRLERTGLVQFIDVGQGDAIFIRTPYGRNLLIDGGGTISFSKAGEGWKTRKDPYEVGRKLLVPLLKKRGVHQLDMLVLSHEDTDHSGGLQAVMEQIPVKQFMFNGTYNPNNGIEKLFQTALDRKIPILAGEQGGWIQIDPVTRLRALYPFSETVDHVEVVKEQNEYSIVLQLEMMGTKWLFTGDMGKNSELALLSRLKENKEEQGRLDVLKIAHHGSKYSTSQEWLDYWQPRTAVISVGVGNLYGHPAPDVIERLRNFGSHVFRTDRMGEVQLEVRKDGLFSRTKIVLP
ncbi:ComEC/Rec2 family competence protein [Paenibacillus chondroitinus]|uniref:ComEC/Rec2 family competence protein n=1 Tax=Paenibacillus chondroitinus TaxID=59842 RepID=A0ABU6DJM8_9BACL|nr:ComEC/Rec2 family competence protein [Paenibacillus chondroitinus]MCY9658481.1 competence protein ComEC family protein [Paenibacillus anseongense]MEB4797193.1 ComEC/Rec2 family competence protein [Paenibacillus chondroitinus]